LYTFLTFIRLQLATTTQDDGDSGDGGPVVDIDLDEVIEAIEELTDELTDFTDNWDETLTDIITEVIFGPFSDLLKFLVTEAVTVLLHTPRVHPNPAVTEVYQQSLFVAYVTAGLAITFTGLLYMMGPLLGVSYREVRMVIPRILVALVFASIALPILQYMVDFSDALVFAFKPDGLDSSMGEMFGTSAALLLVYAINSMLLLMLVIMFVLRSTYILFVASISPLIALGWSLPKVKRYADTFIAGWFTALAMAPLDMIVLKFMFAMMSGTGSTGLQTLSNWVFGTTSAVLLIWIPYQLYGASQAAIGQAYAITRSVKGATKKHRKRKRRKERRQHRQQYWQRQERKWDEYRQELLEHRKQRTRYKSPNGGDGK
jgi:hypothetical protein